MKAKTKRLTIKDLKELIDELFQRGYQNEEAAREILKQEARGAEKHMTQLREWRNETIEAFDKKIFDINMEKISTVRMCREDLEASLDKWKHKLLLRLGDEKEDLEVRMRKNREDFKNVYYYGLLLIVLIQIVTNLT